MRPLVRGRTPGSSKGASSDSRASSTSPSSRSQARACGGSARISALLKNGQMRLYPDADLERELLRLEAKQTGYGWRIDHTSGGFSDRAMAIGMAAMHAAVEGRPSWLIR